MTGDGEHARERMVEQVDEMATDGTVLNLKARFLMHLNTRDFPRALETARELSALDPEDATVKEFQVVIQRWMDLLCMRDDDDDDEEEEESSDHSSNNGDGHAEMDKDCPTSHPDSSHISIFAERLPDVGACEVPDPLHGVPCDVRCEKGEFYTGLLVNRHIEGRCVKCQSGQYSVGGGKVLTNWVPSKAHPSMKSWCVHSLEFGYGWAIGESWVPYRVNTSTDNNSSSERCMSWVASEDGEVVYSGENYGNPDIDSVLRLQDNWLSDGEARFVYMVDGEDEFDGFRFMVDGVMMLGPEYTTVDDDGNLVWKEGSVSLEAGPHTLEWVYSKDMSEDYGYDRAWIRSIELLGTRTVDLECLPCPPGDQRLLTSTVREQCLFCGRDEYPDHNTSVCQQCPPGQYAAPGDSSCSVRPPCTAEDYSIQYSDCDAATWKRTGRYGWSSPIVCDSQLPESVPLPTETITTACEDCPTGSYLDPQEGRCIRCPAEALEGHLVGVGEGQDSWPGWHSDQSWSPQEAGEHFRCMCNSSTTIAPGNPYWGPRNLAKLGSGCPPRDVPSIGTSHHWGGGAPAGEVLGWRTTLPSLPPTDCGPALSSLAVPELSIGTGAGGAGRTFFGDSTGVAEVPLRLLVDPARLLVWQDRDLCRLVPR
ncbi:hypothetical protein FOZ60_015540 [Perkinsus olseni]|uniref:Uncharacterized protein n=1 Tax=Perkinsus olseni TaxID=32597 RepID=A0A7J6P5H9_PEROL|nr:hypothetical protein FOZ60_015540 [Perkinsus olseni]